MKYSKGHVYSAVCKFSPLFHLDGLEENCKKHRPSFECVSKPSSETSHGEILFPYFLNKTLTNFLIQQSEHLVNLQSTFQMLVLMNIQILFISVWFYLRILNAPHVQMVCQVLLVITLKNLTALHEKQHGNLYQVGTMEYNTPYV